MKAIIQCSVIPFAIAALLSIFEHSGLGLEPWKKLFNWKCLELKAYDSISPVPFQFTMDNFRWGIKMFRANSGCHTLRNIHLMFIKFWQNQLIVVCTIYYVVSSSAE